MLENKQQVTFKVVGHIEVSFQDQVIKVKPYLSLTDQAAITAVYLENYFSGDASRVINSEFKLILAVLDFCTDIDIEKLSSKEQDAVIKEGKILEQLKHPNIIGY